MTHRTLRSGTRISLAAAAIASVLMLVSAHVYAGVITVEVVDEKGTISIPNGHFETVFTSRMSLDLGSEWGELAGHFERKNGEKLVWVNDGPPIEISFANVFPREIHVPQTPAPDPGRFYSFFDVFVELRPDGTLGPLEPGMLIVPGPDTYLEGESGTRYPGTVTPIENLDELPTSGINGTEVTWDLSRFSSTEGTFYLIEYQAPPADLASVPEPGVLALSVLASVGWYRARAARGRTGSRRRADAATALTSTTAIGGSGTFVLGSCRRVNT